MARAVKKIPESAKSRYTKYPWTRWFDGRSWRLDYETDFKVEPQMFAHVAKNAARRYGIELTVVHDPPSTVYIQAHGEPEFPETGRKQTEKGVVRAGRKYDWPKYMDGEVHTLKPGRDFKGPAETVRRAAVSYARYNHIALDYCRVVGGELHLKAEVNE